MSCICAVVAAELTAANCMHGSLQAKADQQQLLGALRELGREFSALVCVLLRFVTHFTALTHPRF
jgi:putative heme degradation protein